MTDSNHILSLTKAELKEFAISAGQPSYRAEQVTDWIFKHHAADTSEMSNIPKAFRETLNKFDWSLPEITETLDSDDGSSKLLLRTKSGHHIEMVVLRYDKRVSVCVSSQVGCKFGCRFCQTGKLGFARDLDCAEIISQYYIAARIAASEGRKVNHLVFMGMGEPLDNYDNVAKAVRLLTDEGYGLNPKHVTVSTIGIPDRVVQLSKDVKCSLAISLHAAKDELRTELMPICKRYPLDDLKKALLTYQKATGSKLTFEYIMIKDKNSSRQDVKALVKFLHGFRAKMNLIPFNPHPGMDFEPPSEEEIREFQKYLSARSIPAPVRYSKGGDISAACGQLAAKEEDSLEDRPSRQRLFT